jgi:hypothetical protein
MGVRGACLCLYLTQLVPALVVPESLVFDFTTTEAASVSIWPGIFLVHAGCEDVEEASPALQPLQALTRLADLRLVSVEAEITTLLNLCYAKIPASMLSGTQGLTRLELNLCDHAEVEADVLAGKTLLQHLNLNR